MTLDVAFHSSHTFTRIALTDSTILHCLPSRQPNIVIVNNIYYLALQHLAGKSPTDWV